MVTSVLICRWLKGGAANFLTAEQVWLTTSGLGGILLRLTMTLSRKLISSYGRTVGYPLSDIVLYTGISRGSVHTVVHDHLKFHKVSARWVPRQLKPEQQAVRMIMSLDNLQRCNEEGEGMLERIVTGDETWVHHYQPESKQASMQWKHKDSPTPTKFKVVPSAGKVMATMFWDMKGVLLVRSMAERLLQHHTAVCWKDLRLPSRTNVRGY